MCHHSCYGLCSSFLQLCRMLPVCPMKPRLMLPAHPFMPSLHPPCHHTALKAWPRLPSQHRSLSSRPHQSPYQQLEYQLQVFNFALSLRACV
jgi:hypothetical protein